MQTIRVMTAEDDRFFRLGLASVLETAPDRIHLVAQATSLKEIVALLPEIVPQVLILDLKLGTFEDGVQAILKTREISPTTAILILSAFDEEEWIFRAIMAGAVGYLTKNSISLDNILSLVEQAAQGEPPLSPSIARKILIRMRQTSQTGPPEDRLIALLTAREQEIVRLVAEGGTNREIAARLTIEPSTVKTHVSNILQKLQMTSRVELRKLAHGEGKTGR